MTIRIYGAGMAGLLASEMLRRVRPIVYEAQPTIPDNHGALLRFRSDAVARETRQDFRRVRVLKAVKSGGRLRPVSTIRDANQYALKVTGAVAARSVLDLASCDRYVAPPDFITMMARDAVLKMSAPLTLETLNELKGQREIVAISTIPMPALMKLVGWDNPGFNWRPIWSVTATLLDPLVDVFQTVYYPEPEAPQYRSSITGNRLIIEFTAAPSEAETSEALREAIEDFGLEYVRFEVAPARRQEYGKLMPLEREDIRREFILAMTDTYNLYSVGRFATWRQILLDDVVNDVRMVESMINQRSAYFRRLHNGGALGG